jgi:hypothetical protein
MAVPRGGMTRWQPLAARSSKITLLSLDFELAGRLQARALQENCEIEEFLDRRIAC